LWRSVKEKDCLKNLDIDVNMVMNLQVPYNVANGLAANV
jgi:hypothetical protein